MPIATDTEFEMADDAYVDPNFNAVGPPIGVYPTTNAQVSEKFGLNEAQEGYTNREATGGTTSLFAKWLYPNATAAFERVRNMNPVTPVNVLNQWEDDMGASPEEGNQGGGHWSDMFGKW